MKGKRKGIKTTKRAHPWARRWTAGVKAVKRQAWNMLAVVGLVTMFLWLLKLIGGG